MSIGMSWRDYWYGDVRMTKAYYDAEIRRRKQANAESHLMGLYIYEALCDASPLFLDFVKKGKRKPIPYPTEPFALFGENGSEKTAAEQEQIVKNEQLKAQLFFKNWARAVANKFA